jgi:hypothetical protein
MTRPKRVATCDPWQANVGKARGVLRELRAAYALYAPAVFAAALCETECALSSESAVHWLQACRRIEDDLVEIIEGRKRVWLVE